MEEVTAIGRDMESDPILDKGPLVGAAALGGPSLNAVISARASPGKTAMLKVGGALNIQGKQ